ncbi:MAG: aspartate aminotransferase family protein, partial [Eubacterium sp.]|nr:aspartate aminotransferase family protein [Eubacterium sp.]
GNPIATTAGIETLTALKNHPEIYEELEQKGKRLEEAMKETWRGKATVNRIGSLMSVFFTNEEVTDYESAVKADTKRYADYFSYMLDKGIYLAPSQFEAMFISAAHSTGDIERTCEAVSGYHF